MAIKITLRDGETAEEAYRRLQFLVERSRGQPSHKRRFGYYEKPSELRRKRGKKEAIRAGIPLHIHPFEALFRRTGPTNALMR